MMEKTVEVDMADGTKQSVTLRRILRKERKVLNKIIAPKEFVPSVEFKVEFDKWEEYRAQLIVTAVKSPETFKHVEFLDNLPDQSFNALFNAAQEINGESNSESTEKK